MSRTILAVLLLASAPSVALASQGREDAPVAITNVTVIDPTATTLAAGRLAGRTVLVADGRITRVDPANQVRVPAGYQTIDGRGRFVVPGYWDMHVHFNRDSATAFGVMGPLMIVNGVTGMRDLQSDCWEPCPGTRTITHMRTWQAGISAGDLLAPRLVALSSPIVHGPAGGPGYPPSFPDSWQPGTEAQGRELARSLAGRGVDVIKVYNTIPPAGFRGLVDEARGLGVPVTGHMPWSMSPIEVAQAGMQSIEHARWPVMACNREHESFRAMYERFATREGTFDQEVFDRYKAVVAQGYDSSVCPAIVDSLAAHRVALIPTHVTREMDARAIDSSYRADPRRRYVPPARLRRWDRDLSQTASQSADMQALYKAVFADGLRVTGQAFAAGVTILVGTDAFDTMVFPGLSYHDELEHLARAGLSPLAILRGATYDAAAFLGQETDYGTVAAGKAADLVVLDADPLADIGNAGRIHAVIFRGEVLDRGRLDALVRGVESQVALGR